MFSFIDTLKKLIANQQETSEEPKEYSTEQLLQWATGCMLEGLPDEFYEARISCFRNIDSEGRTAIAAIHDFKLTSERVRLHGLDLSKKHLSNDSRESGMEKTAKW